MSRTTSFASACLLLCSASGWSQGRPLRVPWTRYQLANGLQVLLAPDEGAAEVSVEWWLDTGGRNEPAGRFGIAHFFEHVTPFGNGVIRSSAGRKLWDSLRTDNNAKTRFDYTRYFVQGRPEGLDFFLLVMADRLRADPAADMTPERVEAQRRNVVNEIQRQSSGPFGWPIKYALHSGVFGSAFPYGHHLYGSEDETRDVTRDELVRWYRANARPEYSTLLIVGKFDTTAARVAVARVFEGIGGGVRPPRDTITARPTTRVADSVVYPGTKHQAILAWPVPQWNAPTTPALRLLQRVLSARLARSTPPGVTSQAELEQWQFSGILTLGAQFDDEGRRAVAENALRLAIASLNTRPLSAAELDAAQHEEMAAVQEELGRLGWEESRTELLGESLLFAADPDAYAGILEREARQRPESLLMVAKTVVSGRGFSLSIFPSRQ